MIDQMESGDNEVSYQSSDTSEDELEELQKLRERLKDQSALIALLRERADRGKINPSGPVESPQLQEALQAIEEVREESFRERERADALSRRFDELSDKFAEIVQIKDNYKEQVRSLEVTLRQAGDRQQAMCRPVLEAKNDQIANLREVVRNLERQKGEALAQVTVNGYEDKQLISELKTENDTLKKQAEDLRDRLEQSFAEKRQLEESLRNLEEEMKKTSAEIEKQRSKNDHLRRTIMERGEALFAKDHKISELTVEVEEWRRQLMESVGKYHARTAEVDVDQRVEDLNAQLILLREQLLHSERLHSSIRSASLVAIDKERQESCLLRNVKSVSELIDVKNKLWKHCEETSDFAISQSKSIFTRLKTIKFSSRTKSERALSNHTKTGKNPCLIKT
ncbi:hypothetical protein RvY_10341 [Ramazzottius varieornatus]|uniref:Uncharacterized protein n=1 Tax=Ramazzottius varieornatus TaxID=947166 RepID=A0A1D1VHT3_RAMVA|nr:hypothetical protein RvY_10341 [Ramazzottius varieornatus]